MATGAPHHIFSYDEYLARERDTGLKHEFLSGEVFAMAGGTPEHARLITEVSYAIRSGLDPRQCRLFSSDLKINVEATGLATYPDLAVVCGELQRASRDEHAVVNPRVLVEVLSPSTEAYDRGDKWAHYRRIESLEAYVLVNQTRQRLELYEKQPSGEFIHRMAEAGEVLRVECLKLELVVDAIYAAAV